jgi:hypothetical protein
MLWTEHIARLEEKKKTSDYEVLAGNPKAKRPLGIPDRTWVDNVK